MLKLFGITADIESRNKAFLMFRDEVLDMAQLFGKFVETYMNACFQKNFKKEKDGKTINCVKYGKVKINARDIKDIRVSFFSHVDPKELEQLASTDT